LASGAAITSVLLTVATVAPVAAGAQEPPELGLVPASCDAPFPTYAPEPVATAGATTEHAVTMSDGVVLQVNVTLPEGIDGPFPTALTITGYGKDSGAEAFGTGGGLATHGYAVVVVDDRGTGASGGGWDSWGERTQADYPELLDWLVDQDWSDGTIGVTGASYMGITSLWTAATQHPAVKAVFATVPMGDAYRDITFAGGEVNAAFIPLWMGLVTGLSLNPSGDPEVFVEHLLNVTEFQLPTIADSTLGGSSSYDGPFWRQRSPLEVVDRIDAPTFIVGGLDDLFQRGEPMLYEALAAAGNDARLLIGPWNHLTTGQGLPADGVLDLGTLTLQWFDAHVRGLDTGVACVPPVTQYVRGIEAYRSAPSWPIPGLHAERWHLRGDGTLTSAAPQGDEAGQQYLQAPVTGACTRSANQWLIGLVEQTPCATDNRLDEALSLTYTTDAFTADARIDGPIQADLWLEAQLGGEILTSVAISSVAPDGTSRGLTNGLLRAQHRAVDGARSRVLDGQSIQPWHPFTEDAVQPVPAGDPVLVPVEVFPTSVVIPAGHRLRVTVAAYDVPHALPPLPAALESLAAGPVTVRSDAAHPSSVVLPVAGAPIQTTSDVPSDPSDPSDPAGPSAGDEASTDGGTADTTSGAGVAAAGTGRLPATGAPVPLAAAALALALALLARRAAAR
jgi:putative CocE/NonD family hydrolase